MHLEDELLAFLLDEALMLRDRIEQRWAEEEAKGRSRLPPGFRGETERDLDLSDYDPSVNVAFPELLNDG